MPRSNKTLPNFVAGELSPKLTARIDIPLYQRGLRRCKNFIVLPQGGLQFRNGTRYVKHTRLNQRGVFIPFQFSDRQAYLVEATEGKFRFYKDEGVITESAKTITGVTQANPGVVTSNSHGFSNGDEVFITGVVGMTELNGKFYLVAGAAANTFTLTDVFGNAVDTTAFTAYSSGGSASRVYEITTPYMEGDLEELQFAQSADTMYITHQNYEPRKLTRTAHTSWTLATFSRTADPFTPLAGAITGVTQANPGVVTDAGHGLSTGDVISITGVVGMTQLNGRFYTVTVLNVNTYTLADFYTGVAVDTTAYTAYSSGGTTTRLDEYPRAVTFNDSGRLLYAGTRANPETIWASKAPTSGATAFDNFTTGSGATDALIFTLSPVLGKVDTIQWLSNTNKTMIAGCFGGMRRIYGASEQEPISPTSVTAKPVNAFGCAFTLPVANGADLFYVQRGNDKLQSFGFDISIDGYTTTDRNLVAEHMTRSGLKQVIEYQGSPDTIWGTRNDGVAIGLTYKEKEDISGWHRHLLGGSHVNDNNTTVPYARVLWLGQMLRPDSGDQLWMIVERRVDGNTHRNVEFIEDPPEYLDFVDFYTGEANYEADAQAFMDAQYEVQKQAVHVDAAVTYDGSDLGFTTTITPSATTGNITLTASGTTFTAAMVGREIWKKYDETGAGGGGRARITQFNSGTSVNATVETPFNSTAAIPSGGWYLTTEDVSGLDHLEGEEVTVIVDGGPGNPKTVVNGAIELDAQASVVHVGLGYYGLIESMNLDSGGVTGSAEAKMRIVPKIAMKFLNTLGSYFGTDRYRLQRIIFRSASDVFSRPTSLFTGTKIETYEDSHEEDDKAFVLAQLTPTPCTLLLFDTFMETTDE